ncbi:flagellar hook protein FlgE [Kineothrix alysoides]|uniref:Flagellar hook protein FlgE n=1 Tax=Kineothrix alysoides TaxID=1469948 RepID=A0A4R1QRY7_9FIRM|nr:flagellar hook-basal body complex protein [Kineothrix alysoides]TCL56588.1 flagellar hook protein FlgE [Kineothrix alysoides]
MMRSLYAGVAGLRTHQTKMDVIGNNIANVNTTAYKSQSVTFRDLMYQTTQSASGANATTGVGGTNAKQIGLGVVTGAINTAITQQGSAQTTNNPFDIMITGDAFFVVNNGTQNFFTRDGSFYVDGAGNLAMTSTGYNLMGWAVNKESGELETSVSKLQIMNADNMSYPAASTTNGRMTGIIDKNDTKINSSSGSVMNFEFYSASGYKYTAKFSVHSTTADSQYYIALEDVLDSNGVSIGDTKLAEIAFGEALKVDISSSYSPKNKVTITYNDPDAPTHITVEDLSGNKLTNFEIGPHDVPLSTAETDAIKALYGLDLAGADSNVNRISIAADGTLTVLNKTVNNAAKLNYDAGNGKFASAGGSGNGKLNLTFGSLEGFSTISLDFSSTQAVNNNGSSTITMTSGDSEGLGAGRKTGDMIAISIGKDGKIIASYDNGQSKLLGQIAVAEFANPSGLAKEGDNLYSATANSGEFSGQGVDITANGGYMQTGVLEMSNVDLSQEFTEMITTQRGFQANSRIITVSDTMLEELTNLKR